MRYTYHINLDERGLFYADVRDASGTTVWEIREPNESGYSIFDEGYIRHKNDIAGIERYLRDLKIMTVDDYLTDDDEDVFETSVDDDWKPEMREGGNILTLPHETIQQIKESVQMGYDTVREGMISPKKRGIMLTNKKSQVRGTYPIEYKQWITDIVQQEKTGNKGMSKEEKLNYLRGKSIKSTMRTGGNLEKNQAKRDISGVVFDPELDEDTLEENKKRLSTIFNFLEVNNKGTQKLTATGFVGNTKIELTFANEKGTLLELAGEYDEEEDEIVTTVQRNNREAEMNWINRHLGGWDSGLFLEQLIAAFNATADIYTAAVTVDDFVVYGEKAIGAERANEVKEELKERTSVKVLAGDIPAIKLATSEMQRFKNGGQMNTDPAAWIRSLNVSAFKEDAAKMLQTQILNDPSLDSLQADDEFFIKFKAYVMNNVPEALKPHTGAKASVTSEPQPSTVPSKQILETRLKLINLMLKKDKNNKIAKTRKKLVEAALSKMRDGGGVGKKPKMVRTIFEEEEFEYDNGGTVSSQPNARTYTGKGSLMSYQKDRITDTKLFVAPNGTNVELVTITDPDSSTGMSYHITINGRGLWSSSDRIKATEYYLEEVEKYQQTYAKGGNVSKKPKMVRTIFEEEEFDYKTGGYIFAGGYKIGDLFRVKKQGWIMQLVQVSKEWSSINKSETFNIYYGKRVDSLNINNGAPNSGSFSEKMIEPVQGVDLFEDPDAIPAEVGKILDKYQQAFEDGDYKQLQKAHEELNQIGYTFDYYVDGQAYDLRPIGVIGSVEYRTKMKAGGRPKSALMRDRKYVNNREKYETDYVRKSKPSNPHYKMNEGGHVPSEWYDEYENIVKGYVSDWNETKDKKEVVYGVTRDNDTNMFIVVSGVVDGGVLTHTTEAADDWFGNEADALKVAHAMAYGIDQQEIQY